MTPFSICSFSPETQIKKKCKENDRSSCQTSQMATAEAAAQEEVACMAGEAAGQALVRQLFGGEEGQGFCFESLQIIILIIKMK